MSRPLIGSGQWSQTTTGIFHPADRLSGDLSQLQAFSAAQFTIAFKL